MQLSSRKTWNEEPSERDNKRAFRLARDNDLEGIVAKDKYSPYLLERATWFKIRNQGYSQWVGREELFERERNANPDLHDWDTCVAACSQAALGAIA